MNLVKESGYPVFSVSSHDKFIVPAIIYSYLQGIGIYNDHSVDCEFR